MSYLLVDVVVSSKYQKQGIGKKLVNSIIDAIKNETMAGEYSTINLISIRGMEKFYESCGFEAVPFGYNGKGMRIKIEK
ncbi:MAG: GNAT family N-acetyltransferase [Lachnospiraceae bacterium]|nr:GNAT family N-acetyltransferase [Lachnospiraceae bacterium]